MDNELFTLCKEVYEKTGWRDTDFIYYQNRHSKSKQGDYEVFAEGYEYDASNGYLAKFESKMGDIPLYTSDYLLEKLPSNIVNEAYSPRSDLSLTLESNDGEWEAHYKNDQNSGIGFCFETAKTPLKALLKLCLALHDGGELK